MLRCIFVPALNGGKKTTFGDPVSSERPNMLDLYRIFTKLRVSCHV